MVPAAGTKENAHVTLVGVALHVMYSVQSTIIKSVVVMDNATKMVNANASADMKGKVVNRNVALTNAVLTPVVTVSLVDAASNVVYKKEALALVMKE